jgi:acyl-CoA reductase-like NAD-dependent aldehyde dehydrogenase
MSITTAHERVSSFVASGWGREMGHEVLNNYTEVKAVTTQL